MGYCYAFICTFPIGRHSNYLILKLQGLAIDLHIPRVHSLPRKFRLDSTNTRLQAP